MNAESSHDTIDNIRRITENQEVAMGYYFETNDGEMVTFNVYDVTDTDAADIIGDDVFRNAEDGEADDDRSDIGASSSVLDTRKVHDKLQRIVVLQDDNEFSDCEEEDESAFHDVRSTDRESDS